jgi:hypothetical protein
MSSLLYCYWYAFLRVTSRHEVLSTETDLTERSFIRYFFVLLFFLVTRSQQTNILKVLSNEMILARSDINRWLTRSRD